MYNLMKSEFLKLKRSKVFKYILSGMILITTFMVVCEILGVEKYRKPGESWGIDSLYTFVGYFTHPEIVAILSSMFTIVYICNDFEDKIIQSQITSGCKRLKIILSKSFICYIVVFILNLIHSLVPAIVIQLVYRAKIDINFITFMQAIRVYLISSLIMCAIASFGILAAFILKTSGIANSIFFVGLFIYVYFVRLLEDYFECDGFISKYTFFELSHLLDLEMDKRMMYFTISISLLTILACVYLAYSHFKKAELK